MNERERLIELLEDCQSMEGYGMDLVEKYADHLLSHGVTVQRWIPASEPPKKPGTYQVSVYDKEMERTWVWYGRFLRVAEFEQEPPDTLGLCMTSVGKSFGAMSPTGCPY